MNVYKNYKNSCTSMFRVFGCEIYIWNVYFTGLVLQEELDTPGGSMTLILKSSCQLIP